MAVIKLDELKRLLKEGFANDLMNMYDAFNSAVLENNIDTWQQFIDDCNKLSDKDNDEVKNKIDYALNQINILNGKDVNPTDDKIDYDSILKYIKKDFNENFIRETFNKVSNDYFILNDNSDNENFDSNKIPVGITMDRTNGRRKKEVACLKAVGDNIKNLVRDFRAAFENKIFNNIKIGKVEDGGVGTFEDSSKKYYTILLNVTYGNEKESIPIYVAFGDSKIGTFTVEKYLTPQYLLNSNTIKNINSNFTDDIIKDDAKLFDYFKNNEPLKNSFKQYIVNLMNMKCEGDVEVLKDLLNYKEKGIHSDVGIKNKSNLTFTMRNEEPVDEDFEKAFDDTSSYHKLIVNFSECFGTIGLAKLLTNNSSLKFKEIYFPDNSNNDLIDSEIKFNNTNKTIRIGAKYGKVGGKPSSVSVIEEIVNKSLENKEITIDKNVKEFILWLKENVLQKKVNDSFNAIAETCSNIILGKNTYSWITKSEIDESNEKDYEEDARIFIDIFNDTKESSNKDIESIVSKYKNFLNDRLKSESATNIKLKRGLYKLIKEENEYGYKRYKIISFSGIDKKNHNEKIFNNKNYLHSFVTRCLVKILLNGINHNQKLLKTFNVLFFDTYDFFIEVHLKGTIKDYKKISNIFEFEIKILYDNNDETSVNNYLKTHHFKFIMNTGIDSGKDNKFNNQSLALVADDN